MSNPEELLAKTLKANKKITFGQTIGTDANGNCTVQTDDGSILARSPDQISAGSAIALKADDGQWYAVSARQSEAVSKSTLLKTRNNPDVDITEIQTQVVFLFKRDNNLYVGGDRDEPELIYEGSEGESVNALHITKVGELINDYKVMFTSTESGEESKLYFNTIINNEIFRKDFTTDIGGDLAASFDFLGRDGSFIGTGSTAQITSGVIPPYVDIPAISYQAILDWALETDGGIWRLGGGETLPLEAISLTLEVKGYLEIPEDITGTALGSRQRFYLYDTKGERPFEEWEITHTRVSEPTFITFEAIPSGQPCSLFARPEDGLVRDMESDSLPLLKTYYTNSQFTTGAENLETIGFNSGSLLFKGSGDKLYVKRSDGQQQEIEVEEIISQVNNFIENKIYQVAVEEIQAEGTLTVKTINISQPSTPVVLEDISIEYRGVSLEFQPHIINYSVFF